MEIDLSPGSIPRLRERIAEMRARVENLQPILKRQALTLSGLIDESFRKGQSPTGEVWKPLAASTIEKRRQGSSKPLLDTGMLRQSTNARATQAGVLFGTSGAAASYGVFHVKGTKHIPRRSYLPIDADGNADFSSGPAAAWLEKTRNLVADFILRGENQR